VTLFARHLLAQKASFDYCFLLDVFYTISHNGSSESRTVVDLFSKLPYFSLACTAAQYQGSSFLAKAQQ